MLLSRIFFILTINKWQLALQHGIDGFKVMVIFLSCLEKQQRTKALSKRVIRRMAFHYLDRKPSEASWSTGFCTVPLCAVSFLGWSGQRAPPRFWNSWLDFPTASQQWLPAGNELSCPLATRWADTGCPNEGVTRNAAFIRLSEDPSASRSCPGICLSGCWKPQQSPSRGHWNLFFLFCEWRKARSQCHLLLVFHRQFSEYLLSERNAVTEF